MSDELTTNPSSEETQGETPVVETPATEAPAEPNLTEEILAGLEKQFSGIDDDTTPVVAPQKQKEEKTETPVETSDIEEVEEYDPDELYTSTRSNPEVESLKTTVARLENELKAIREAPKSDVEGAKKKPYDILPLVTEEEFEDALSSPENFNRLLNRTLYTAFEMAQRQSGVTATQVVYNTMNTQRTVDSYFASNPDLKPHEKLMSLVWQDVAASKPQASLPELLLAAGEETRRVLKLKGVKTGKLKNPADQRPQRPAFAKPSGGGARGDGTGKVAGGRGWDW